MAKNISRFVQISDVVLLEYSLNKEFDHINSDQTDLMNISQDSHIVTLPTNEKVFIDKNYDNNLALPVNKIGTEYFNVLDGTSSTFDNILDTYSKLYEELEYENTAPESVPYDTVKLHIVNGYSFEGTYGFFLKIFTDSSVNNGAVLLQYTYNKLVSKFTYNRKPIYFSNRVYDKYIEFKIPSIQYLSIHNNSAINSKLKIKEGLNNIKITYCDLFKNNYTVHSKTLINAFESMVYGSSINDVDSGEFNVSEKYSTALPMVANTDKFNLYIAESTKGDYFEYYGTWNGSPLTPSIVNKFNTLIPLYTISKDSYENRYEASELENYQMWYVQHSIKATVIDASGNNILLDDFNNIQYFDTNSATKFYYKPIIERLVEQGISSTGNILVLDYECKLINNQDGMQILRKGSLSTNLDKYYKACTSNLSLKDTYNYKIINKIYNTDQHLNINNDNVKVKYTKVFYNSNNINLTNVTGTYTMKLADSPKNYKFVFTQNDTEGNTKFFNFSNSYYKLYSKDKDGKDIYIDATYSDNMNTILGELEFHIPQTMINKLKNVPVNKRFMSIVVVNQDNTISTLYEFTYE